MTGLTSRRRCSRSPRPFPKTLRRTKDGLGSPAERVRLQSDIAVPKEVSLLRRPPFAGCGGAIAEAIYALDILKAAGVILEASKFGVLLGTSRYERLYEVLNDHNATVFVHPGNDPCPKSSEESISSSTGLDPFVVDYLLDTTRATANLVYRNVTRDYPNITFMLAHSGGFFPFAATRVAGGLAYLSGTPTKSSESTYYGDLSEFNVDLADSATRTALPSTTAFFNISRIT